MSSYLPRTRQVYTTTFNTEFLRTSYIPRIIPSQIHTTAMGHKAHSFYACIPMVDRYVHAQQSPVEYSKMLPAPREDTDRESSYIPSHAA